MSDKLKNMCVRALTGIVFVAVVFGAVWCSRWTFWALLAVVGVGCYVEFLRLVRPGFLTVLAGGIYIGLPLGLFSLLGMYEWRFFALTFFLILWASDVFAYLTGVAFGRYKLAPKISPKKTWEGFVGGVLGAIGMGLLAAWAYGENYLAWAGVGVVIAVAGVVGDLFESWLKRRAGVKDSGNMLPGHGGFLDRFDSMLFAVPAVAVYLFLLSRVGVFL